VAATASWAFWYQSGSSPDLARAAFARASGASTDAFAACDVLGYAAATSSNALAALP